jgi:type IV pilus assembly protein PilO
MRKFDWSKLKEMNNLDFETMDVWPFEVKTVFAVLVFLIVSGASYYFLVSDKFPQLEQLESQEQQLKSTFKAKYAMAVNLRSHKQNLDQMEQSFAQLLKLLPTDNETPGLIDDITFVGTKSGLIFRRIEWLKEDEKEFYAELPIAVEVQGQFHDFGQFVSQIAALPRIVTTHDFEIQNTGNELQMQIKAQTYRYQEASLDTALEGSK